MDQREYKDLGDLHFHYKKEEREESLSNDVRERLNEKKLSIFKRNPTLLLIFADIVIIILISTLVSAFLLKKDNVKNFHGYSIDFRGILYEEKSLLSLKITAGKDFSDSDDLIMEIIFSINGQAETFKSSIAPPSTDGAFEIVRTSFPAAASGESASADIKLGDKSITLKTKLGNEF